LNYYIELGMYDASTFLRGIKLFPDFDHYIGFEPVPILYKSIKKSLKKKLKRKNLSLYNKITLERKAASIVDNSKVKFYVGKNKKSKSGISEGSTLNINKTSGQISKENFIHVQSVDFSQYILENFKEDDFIVLKVDIEGEEYNLFQHMITEGSISYIDKIFCEWHYKKIKNVNETDHNNIVACLNKFGFELTGHNSDDDFSRLYSRR